MSSPTISIIIPVYNIEEYLPQCLDSVLAQTFTDIEVLCVNDGSKDASLQILETYARKDNRVVIISQENSGASYARNAALDRATGAYIMFVDGDDWIDTQTCERAYAAAVAQNADVVLWDYVREFADCARPKKIFSENRVFEKADVLNLHRRLVGLCGSELKSPEKADALATSCAHLYKRSIIEEKQIRFYDIRKIGTFEDGLFNLNFFEYAQKAVYLADAMYHYRKTNVQSVTTKYKEHLKPQHENIHDYLDVYITERNLGAEYKTALQNRIALELVGYGLNLLRRKKMPLREIHAILSEPKYRHAYAQLELKHMPIHWKAFYACAKYRFTFGVYCLLVCIKKIIRK